MVPKWSQATKEAYHVYNNGRTSQNSKQVPRNTNIFSGPVLRQEVFLEEWDAAE